MTRVVILGISGLDADLLRVYGPSLPDVRRLMLHSPFLEMRSCFPPEPVPAWASIYTGLHPANHGILTSGEPSCECPIFSNASYAIDENTYAGHRQGASLPETFWCAASRAGKRVCVVNPLLTMPAEKGNSMMLAQPLTRAEVKRAGTPGIPSMRQLEAFCN